jgi:hypothetical protein
MGIEDIQISEELQTDAPSIKYSGNEGPKSPQQMQEMMMAQIEEEYSKYLDDMIEQGLDPMSFEQFLDQVMAEGQMAGGNPLPNDPTKPVNPFAPKPTGPVLPDRQNAAYGGIMGLDGRKKYFLGSFFQKKIMDPIKLKFYGFEDEGGPASENTQLKALSQKRVNNEPEGYESYFDTLFKGEKGKDKEGNETRTGGLNKQLIPIIGGAMAGLFTKKNEDGTTSAMAPDQTALALADLKKSANILDQKQGLAAGMNFLPAVSARKYSPAEMINVYQNAANGGRIGFSEGTNLRNRMSALMNKMANGTITPEEMVELRNMESASMFSTAKGMAEGGIMDLGGMEKDYRAEGGFVPIGRKEKADDVPARLSVNEFVFTADAVRNAGGGDIDKGAQVMENMMRHLEQGGQVSEESQGMAGARDMFATSQRLGEVI